MPILNCAPPCHRARLAHAKHALLGILIAGSALIAVRAQTSTANALPAPRSGTSQLPVMGDGSDMTASAERRLGDRIAREIFRDPDYIDDPVLAEYVDGIWQPLLKAAHDRGEMSDELQQRFAWQIMMGKDRSVNAFALPGGYLGLHLGLVAVVTSRDELASVLAHELSHVTQRHISRLTSQQNAQTPWVIGALILSALAASKNTDAASAVLAGGQALAMQSQLNFSRDMEREADRVGFGLMADGGFAPQGFASMFEKLQAASRLNDNGAYPYLRSHPLTSERIADIQGRLPIGSGDNPAPLLRTDHAMLSARARVLSNPAIDSLRDMQAQARARGLAELSPAQQAGTLYAAALAAAQMRDYSGAGDDMARLRERTTGDKAAQRLFRLLDIEIALMSGQPAEAFAPTGRAEMLLMSQLWIRQGRGGDAASALQSWVAIHPRDAGAWQMLARANTAQGQVLRAVRAEAEAQVALLDYAAAMDRFKAAQAMARGAAGTDHIEASIIDTRTRQVQSLLREQALER
jgi:predicted Zn-dependent protease